MSSEATPPLQDGPEPPEPQGEGVGEEEAPEEAVDEADNGGKAKPKRSKPTREEMQERGRKGGLASGASRRGERTPGDHSDQAIVAKLRNKAAKGDIAAARELREWQHLDPESDAAGDEWLALLTTRERLLVRDLLRHVRGRKLGQVEGEWQVPTDDALPSEATSPALSPSTTGGEGEPEQGDAEPIR